MYLFSFITLNLLWGLYQCVNVSFDINIGSLIEFDANEEQVLLNTYTEFTARDWKNATLFRPMLPNNGYLEMNIARIPQNNELKYAIGIHNWPWDNENNSVEFCFHISISNGNDLQFKCSNKVVVSMQYNNIDICHRFHYNQQIDIAHIYYSTRANYTKYYSTIATNITYNDKDSNEFLISSNGGKHEYIFWLFGVCLTISAIVCLFTAVICYLTKKGFFDDTPKQFKRKRSTIIIGNGMGMYCMKGSPSTYSGDTNSLPASPKKNLRINVTYHSPRRQGINNNDMNNNLKINTNLFVDDIKNDTINQEPSNTRTFTHTRTNTKTRTKTNTCDTIRIIDALLEGNEEDELDSDDSDERLRTITPIVPNTNGDNEFDHESSLIQYIITCSNNSSREVDCDKKSSPIPFI